MLETQRGGDYQNQKHNNLGSAPFACDAHSTISALLPKPSDVSCRCAGIACNQIARPYGSGEVCALGQVLPLVARGEYAAVTTWGWSTPCAHLSFFSDNDQGPTSIDELYCTPTDLVLPEDIHNSYAGIANLNSGKPKEQQRYCSNQSYAGKRNQGYGKPFSQENHTPGKAHDDAAGNGNGSAGSRSEYLHAMSLACRQEVLS